MRRLHIPDLTGRGAILTVPLAMMTKRPRVEAVLQGQRPDHPPVSCWYHFARDQQSGPAAVDAHLRHLEKYDLDFLKVMHDLPFPRGEVGVVRTAADLRQIRPLPGGVGSLGEQLQLIRELSRRVGPDVLLCTTLFNPWTTLRLMTRPPSYDHGPPQMVCHDDRDETLTALLNEDRAAVRAALEALARTMAAFVRQALAAGADGVYLSVRDDWVNTPANGPQTYEEMVRPADLIVLDAASDAPFNVLHICGRPQNFRGFAEYPVQVLHWADRAAGPSLAYARDRAKPALAGGVDNLKTLPQGTPDDVAAEVRDALRQAKGRPIIIAPGCTFDPMVVPQDNLRAMVDAARQGYE